MIASDSQTASPESVIRQGTFPDGECLRMCSFESGWPRRTSVSSKGMSKCLSTSHGRIDQDDEFLSPITSFMDTREKED